MIQKLLITFGGVVGLLTLGVNTPVSSADQGPPNATSVFLGPQSGWKDVQIVVQGASPVFGAREYYISGSGTVLIVDVRRGPEIGTVERRFELEDVGEPVNEIVGRILERDLLDPDIEESDEPLPACAVPGIFIVRNGQKEMRQVRVPAGDAGAAYREVMKQVEWLMWLAFEKEPVYQDEYDPSFIPKDFSWARGTLGPKKSVLWAPFPGPQQRAQAEEEYQERVEAQLKAIRKAEEEETSRRD